MIGERVNNYQIISLLGEGGMGAVYLAEHPFMGRKAAIKVLRREFAEDVSLVDRFMNEARAANAIRHPNIIDIIDVGQLASGIPYLMMEYLDGQSLARRIESERPMAIADALDIAIQTASALRAAHDKGIVHRDLKPDNLFLILDGSLPLARVKVLDFGIAKLRGELSGNTAKTQSGAIMGTPPYMSPEQCRGVSDEIDHRTDIYALGIILYEMLSGAPPFMSEGWGDVVLMHLTRPPSSLRAKNQDVSPQLEAIIMKALAKSRDERWASMEEIEIALRRALPVGRRPARGAMMAVGAVTGIAASPIPTTLKTASGEVDLAAAAAARFDQAPAPSSGPRRGKLALALVLGAAAAAVIAVGAARRSRESTGAGVPPVVTAAPAPAAASPPAAPAPPPAAPVAATPDKAVAAPIPAAAKEPEAAPTAEERPPAEAPEPEAHGHGKAGHTAKGAHGKKGAHHGEATSAASGPAPTGPAARSKPSCDPNFYLDAQGEKHFKPECF